MKLLEDPIKDCRKPSVNRFTVYRLISQKKIPAFKVGGQWRFKQEMIDAWLGEHSTLSRKGR